MTVYLHRDLLKSALSLPGSATDKHLVLDAVLEGVCREIDAYCGVQFGPSSQTRYYRPERSTRLDLDYPLLNIDSVTLDTDGNASYESTLDSTAYFILPDNATMASPPQPFWALELRPDNQSSCCFPVGIARGARVQGTWGWYDQRTETSAKPSTAVTAAATLIKFTGASGLHPGQMVRLDSEQILIERNGLSGSDTATTSGQVTVKRAQNGTVGATHSSNSTMSVYSYPIIDAAARMQAEMDYRAMDAPLGISAGDMSGGQPVRAAGGLHPFVRRQLDVLFRVPTVA